MTAVYSFVGRHEIGLRNACFAMAAIEIVFTVVNVWSFS